MADDSILRFQLNDPFFYIIQLLNLLNDCAQFTDLALHFTHALNHDSANTSDNKCDDTHGCFKP
jgi:hypothetical protein